jgi:hypothetical protein
MNIILSFSLVVATFFSCKNAPEPTKQNLPEKLEVVSSYKIEVKELPVSKSENLTKNETKIDSGATFIKKETAQVPIKPRKEKLHPNTKTNEVLKVNHDAWNNLLKKYVDDKGNVAYASFKNDSGKLQSYLDYLAANAPSNSWSKNEKLAYYINLYNAATVKLILDNYPTKSIKDIKKPWGKKWVKVGDDVLSLGNIEHKILRKMNEPRIHFAINCASYSCPKLVNSAFTAGQMEKQLQSATEDFVNDTTRNKFDENTAQLSEIFKWYKSDFTDNGTVLEYIKKYGGKPINTKSKVSYLKYDWSLNETK